MIISVTYESPDILRLYPPQLDIDGKALAERVDGLAMHDMDLENAENDKNKAEGQADDLRQSLSDLKDTVKDAIRELNNIIVERPVKPVIMATLAELLKKLKEAHG